jgi:hypothetical protein
MGRLYAVRFLLCFVVGVFVLNAVATFSPSTFAPESILPVVHQPQGSQWSFIPKLLTLDALLQPVAAAGVCSPYGDPINGSKYKGNNSFYLCSEGDPVNVLGRYNNTRELRIACKADSHRAGWKWHIWCTSDGGACNCNSQEFYNGHANWSAGDHCVLDGSAAPGANGCANW